MSDEAPPARKTALITMTKYDIRESHAGGIQCRGEFVFSLDDYATAKAIAEKMNGMLVSAGGSLQDEVVGCLEDKVKELEQQLLGKERAYNARVVEMTQKTSMLEQQLIRLHRLELEIEELSIATAPRPQLHA